MSEIKNFLETATSKNRGVMKQLLEYILVSPDIATIFKEAKLSDSMVRLFKGLNTNQYDKQIETVLNQGIFKSKKKEILATLEELKELSKDSITGTAGQLKRIQGIINPISASLREMANEIRTKEEEGKRAELSELRTRFKKKLATSKQKIKGMEQEYGREGGFRDTPKVKKIVDDLKQSISSFREQFLQEERPEETASYASILENKTKYELVTDISNFTESNAEKYIEVVEENLTGIKSKVMRAKDLEGGGIMPAKFYKKNSIALVEGLDYLMKENVSGEWWARAFTLSTTRQVITQNTLISRIYVELVKPLLEKSSDVNFNPKLENFLQKLGSGEQNTLNLESIFRAFFGKLRKKVVTEEKTTIRGDKLFETDYTKDNHREMIQTAAENYVGLRNKFRKFMKTTYSTELDSLKGIIVNNLQEELGTPPAIESQFPKNPEYKYKDGTIYDSEDEVATLQEIREDTGLTPEIISEIEQFLAIKPATEGGFSAYLQSKSAQKGSIEAYLDSLLEKNRNYNTKNIDNLVGIVIEMSLIMPNDPPFENLEDELLGIFEDTDREDKLEEVENALPKKMNDYTKRIAKGFGLKLKDFIENHPSYRLSDNVKGKLLSAFASSGLIRGGFTMTISNDKIDELKEEVQLFLEGNPSTSEVKVKRRNVRSKLRELYSAAISIPLKEATKKIEDIKSQYKDNPEERDSKIKEIEEQFYREVPKSRRKEKNLSWFFANAGSSERTSAESETQYETLTELPPEESKKLIKEIFGTEKGDLLLDALKDIEVQYKGGSLTGREFAKHPNPSRYRNSTFKNLDTISVEDIGKLRESKNPAFKIIVNKLQEMKEKETTTYEGLNINADSLIAGFSLSKASEREKIYKFWQDVVKKEKAFFKALDSFKSDLAAIKIDKSEQGAFMEKLARFDKLFEDDSKLNDLKYLKAFSPEMKEVPNPLGLLLNILAFESAKHDAEESAFEDDSPQELADFISDYSAYIPDTESGGGGGTKASFDIYKPDYIESIDSDEQDEIIELEKTMENIDPLLLYDMEVNKTYVLIQKTISQYKEDKKEWEETDAVKFMKDFVEEYRESDELDPEDRDDYLEIIDSLQDTFALTQGEKAVQSESYGKEILEGQGFVLPIFVAYEPAFRRALEDTKNIEIIGKKIQSKAEEVDEAIFELIEFLTEFMNVSFQFAQTQGKKARKIEGYQKDTPMASFGQRDKVKVGDLEQSVLQTMKGKRFKNEMAKDLKDAFTPLLTAMSDYYFKPFFRNRDVGGKPKYLSSREGRKLVLLANDLGVDDLLGSSYQNILRSTVGKRSSLQKKIKVKDFQNIYNFLLQTRNPKNFDALINDGENASKSLTKIFGKKYSERNNNTIAKIIAALNKKMRKLPEDNPHKRNTEEYKEYEEKAGMVSKFNEKAISTRERQYNKDIKSGLEIPLFALPYWLTMNKRSFTKDTYKNIFADLESYYDSSENVPQVLTKMLLVHDEIRKMLGKDVVQGFYALQYRDIDDFITKMHQEKDLDLSHMEVTEIVKSYDSHENISKEYGISSDEVYLVKANFR